MKDWMSLSKLIIKLVFYFIIPGLTVLFRIKKKVKTGFAVGIILTSFILGLFGTASITENPFERFEKHINNKNHAEAKKALKIIIQFGPDHVNQIDEKKIVYKDLYNSIKKELIIEYEEIANRYFKKYTIGDIDCSNLVKNKENVSYLNHALLLLGFSESIGGKHEVLKGNIQSKVNKCEKRITVIEARCEKNI